MTREVGMFRIFVDIPSLDRLVTYLEAKQQVEIDGLATQVKVLTNQLVRSSTELNAAIEGEKNAV